MSYINIYSDQFSSFIEHVKENTNNEDLSLDKFKDIINGNLHLRNEYNHLLNRTIELKQSNYPKGSVQHTVLLSINENEISETNAQVTNALKNNDQGRLKGIFSDIARKGNTFVLNEILQGLSKDDKIALFDTPSFINSAVCVALNGQTVEVFLQNLPQELSYQVKPELTQKLLSAASIGNNFEKLNIVVNYYKAAGVTDFNTLLRETIPEEGIVNPVLSNITKTENSIQLILDLLPNEEIKSQYILDCHLEECIDDVMKSKNVELINFLVKNLESYNSFIVKKIIAIANLNQDDFLRNKTDNESFVDGLATLLTPDNYIKILTPDLIINILEKHDLFNRLFQNIPTSSERLKVLMTDTDTLLHYLADPDSTNVNLSTVETVLAILEPQDQAVLVTKKNSLNELSFEWALNSGKDDIANHLWQFLDKNDKISCLNKIDLSIDMPKTISSVFEFLSSLSNEEIKPLSEIISNIPLIEEKNLKLIIKSFPNEIIVKILDKRENVKILNDYLDVHVDLADIDTIDDFMDILEFKKDDLLKNTLASLIIKEKIDVYPNMFLNAVKFIAENNKLNEHIDYFFTSKFNLNLLVENNIKTPTEIVNLMPANVFTSHIVSEWLIGLSAENKLNVFQDVTNKLMELRDSDIINWSRSFSVFINNIFSLQKPKQDVLHEPWNFYLFSKKNQLEKSVKVEVMMARVLINHCEEWVSEKIKGENSELYKSYFLKFPQLFYKYLKYGDIDDIVHQMNENSVNVLFLYEFHNVFNYIDSEEGKGRIGTLINSLSPELQRKILVSTSMSKYINSSFSKPNYSVTQLFKELNLSRTPFNEAVVMYATEHTYDSDVLGWFEARKGSDRKHEIMEALQFKPFFSLLLDRVDTNELLSVIDLNDLPDILCDEINAIEPNIYKLIIENKYIPFINALPDDVKFKIYPKDSFIRFLHKLYKFDQNINSIKPALINLPPSPALEVSMAQAFIRKGRTDISRNWVQEVLKRENAADYILAAIELSILELFSEEDFELVSRVLEGVDLSPELQRKLLPQNNSPSQIRKLVAGYTDAEIVKWLHEDVVRVKFLDSSQIEGLQTEGSIFELITSYNKAIKAFNDSPDDQALLLNPLIKAIGFHQLAVAFNDVQLRPKLLKMLSFFPGPKLAVMIPLMTDDELLKVVEKLDESKRKEIISYSTAAQRKFLLSKNIHFPNELVAWNTKKEKIASFLLIKPADVSNSKKMLKFQLQKDILINELSRLDPATEIFSVNRMAMDKALTARGDTPENLAEEWDRADIAIEKAQNEIRSLISGADEILSLIPQADKDDEIYLDMITGEEIIDPIRMPDGNVLDRSTLERYKDRKGGDVYINPFNNKEILDVKTDIVFLNELNAWKAKKAARNSKTG